MSPDFLDRLLTEWLKAAPGIDTASLGIVTRIRRLANYLEKRAAAALAPLGLALWQFEVLTALLHAPARQGMHACHLLPAALLSPAAMTNRLDRLESSGWILRQPDPADRRATRVLLTPAGRALARRALKAYSNGARHALAGFTEVERTELDRLLREFLRGQCESECPLAASDSLTSNS
ncbi:MAG: MarR family transcriptional regulator [Bryobacterales bacterium]|nr:MarR family transcriptional regulator [Bryobacterales bacterium]